jgi:aryl sulfotransferase
MAATENFTWPVKTRELQNHHMNSKVWNDFEFRDGDVVIATYAKSGTTWMQQIVSQLIFDGAEGTEIHKLSPWVDFRLLPVEVLEDLQRQPHRRFMKTHLPVDALVFSPRARYLYVGRDGRDTAWSFFNHYANYSEERRIALNGPGLVGPPYPPPPPSAIEFYRTWFAENGKPIWPFWENIRSWWAVRDLPNVKFVHFNTLKSDLAGSISSIAAFLDIKLTPESLSRIESHCTFDYMKRNAALMAPRGGASFAGGAATFINKGSNGRWRDELSADESDTYEVKAIAELGPDCAHWLATGEMVTA